MLTASKPPLVPDDLELIYRSRLGDDAPLIRAIAQQKIQVGREADHHEQRKHQANRHLARILSAPIIETPCRAAAAQLTRAERK